MYVILQYEHRAHVCKQTTEREGGRDANRKKIRAVQLLLASHVKLTSRGQGLILSTHSLVMLVPTRVCAQLTCLRVRGLLNPSVIVCAID